MSDSASCNRSLNVRFVKADIATVTADAVVTGEDPDLEHESFVTSSLINKFPEFRTKRAELKRKTPKGLLFGEVLFSHLERPHRAQNKRNFQIVLHAVLDNRINNRSPDLVITKMEYVYASIFDASESLGVSSLALPLLGTGAAGTDAMLVITALARSIVNTVFDKLTDLMVVCTDEVILSAANRQLIYEGQGKNSSQWLKVDGKPIDTMENQADNDLKERKPHLSMQNAPGNTHPERRNNHTGRAKCCPTGAVGYDRDMDERRPMQDKEQLSTMGLPHSKNNVSSRYEDVNDQTHPVSSSMEQANKSGMYEGNRLKKNQTIYRPLDQSKSPRGRQRTRHGSAQEATPLSDEMYARCLQYREESISGKSVEQELLKHSRRGDDLESPNHSQEGEDPSSEDSKPQEETCSICLNTISDPKKLDKCGHVFCKACIERSFLEYKPVCPSCNMVYGKIRGNQPDGHMDVDVSREHLPGYESCGTIIITYYFPDGRQQDGHPRPGRPFRGTTRCAYLPDNREGKEILGLLKTAFDRRLTFTIGRSTTTGREGVVTWNDIHHKTSIDGGPTRFGYPDETYLSRVRDELASKGVTEPTHIQRSKKGSPFNF